MDGEVIADLRGQPAGPCALGRERLIHDLLGRAQQRLALVGRELRERRVGREPRAMQDVVAVPAADAGHGPLVAQDRVHAARVVGLPDPVGEPVRQHLGPQLLERPVVAGREHPPPGLALLAELLQEHARPVLGADPQDAPARLRGLRWGFHIHATALRQMEQQPVAAVQVDDDELPSMADVFDRPPEELVGARGVRLQGRELQHVERPKRPAAQHVVQALGQRLHLRELRHGPRPVPATRGSSRASPRVAPPATCANTPA